MTPTPLPMTSSKPIALAKLLSARSVVKRPAPITMRIQPTYIGTKYLPVILTTMPATSAIRLMVYDNPKISTPAPVGDFSLHASKKSAYQSDGVSYVLASKVHQIVSSCVQLKVANTTAIKKFWM